MQTSNYSLEDLIEACEEMLQSHGFLSYSTIAQQFGVTRQAVQLRLRRAHERGEISDFMRRRLSPVVASDTVSREFAISPENDDFVQEQAKKHQTKASTIVDAALSRYRAQLQE